MRTWHTFPVPDSNPYRDLPSVDDLATWFHGRLPHPLLVDLARSALETARREIADGKTPDVIDQLDGLIGSTARSAGVEVINATGVILHTNLGRARWSEEAADAAALVSTGYSNVELDLATGERSSRGSYVAKLLRALTGAEDALVVNNNASGLLLALAATSAGRSVPVARGELIEIGGSYRLPEVMDASGAKLVEVGTTNRTRLGDFETASQLHDCGSILKVHPSNYRVEGFTEEAQLSQLAELAGRLEIPLIYDIGSGLLDADTPWLEGLTPEWLRDEPAARQAIFQGADLVTFSGDKLLGGPQAGIIIGGAPAISQLRSHPLMRALRVDGGTLAGLAATLEAYARKQAGHLPFWRQALTEPNEILARAERVAGALGANVISGMSAIGAGSVPGMSIPTSLVVLEGQDHLHRCLLAEDPPIVARQENGALVMDLRTVDPDMDEVIIETLGRCR